MKDFVRGALAMLLTVTCVAIVYANSADATTQANYTPDLIENNISDTFNNNLVNTINISAEPISVDDEKKLVKTTGSVKAAGAGASRGAFTATAYCLSGRTAMGHGVRRGLIAADPRVLKLGSRVTINGGAYNGSYLVSDTGGKIKGKKIDIWVPSCSEARKFGRRTVQISQ